MPADNTVTLDREFVENFIVEVDALATFDSIRNYRQETALQTHIYGILEPFELAALGRMSDQEGAELHQRANQRGRELAREWFGYLFEREGVAAGA